MTPDWLSGSLTKFVVDAISDGWKSLIVIELD
jgi:hypothetical protein